MSDGAMKSGPGVYSAGFLPAVYQGTVFRSGEYPVLNLAIAEGRHVEGAAKLARPDRGAEPAAPRRASGRLGAGGADRLI